MGEGPVPLRKIAEEQNLSEAYLEQLNPTCYATAEW